MGFMLDAVTTASNVGDVANKAYKTFLNIVNVIFPIVIGIVLALGLFYGITLAIKYAKAEEDEDKKKAKGSLINVVVGVLVAVVFVAVIQILLNSEMIEKLFPKINTDEV